MDDIGTLGRHRVTERANAGGGHQKTEMWRPTGIHARDADPVDRIESRCGRHDDDLMPSSGQSRCEISKVQLDAADARRKPVADERDLHRGFVTAWTGS